MTRPRFRPAARAAMALAAAIAVVFVAAACRVQPGAAAFVGDYRISESQVNEYVSSTPPASDATQGLPPRAQVVAILVSTRMYRNYLQTSGGVPSASELDASRNDAFTLITGSAAPDAAQLQSALERLGFRGAFADAYFEQLEVQYFAIQRSNAQNLAALAQAVTERNATITISPRYGKWDPAQLSLAGGSGTPDYLTLSSAAPVPVS